MFSTNQTFRFFTLRRFSNNSRQLACFSVNLPGKNKSINFAVFGSTAKQHGKQNGRQTCYLHCFFKQRQRGVCIVFCFANQVCHVFDICTYGFFFARAVCCSAYLKRGKVHDFLVNTLLSALYVIENAEHEAVPLQTKPAYGCVTRPVILLHRLHYCVCFLFRTNKQNTRC